MKFQDEFRDRKLVTIMADNIRRMARQLKQPVNFMEVCGTHTMVCVTPVGYMDAALACAADPVNIVATFGDMLRVPGSSSSLMEQRALGADVRIVYSPLDAVALAQAPGGLSGGRLRNHRSDGCRQHPGGRPPGACQLLRAGIPQNHAAGNGATDRRP